MGNGELGEKSEKLGRGRGRDGAERLLLWLGLVGQEARPPS